MAVEKSRQPQGVELCLSRMLKKPENVASSFDRLRMRL